MKSHIRIEKIKKNWTLDIYSEPNHWGHYSSGYKTEKEVWINARKMIKNNCNKEDKFLKACLEPEQLTLF